MPVLGHILVYHRVAAPLLDPHGICVSRRRFAEHLRLLCDRYQPITLDRLLEGREGGDLPRNAVCVTFDDGYADNAVDAWPLLEDFGVPATVFVATANLDTEVEFWWDRLEAIFLGPGALPARLSLRIGRLPFRAELGADREWGEEEVRRHAGWAMRSEPPPTRRHDAYARLFRRLQRLDATAVHRALERLADWADRAPSERSTHRSLSAERLQAMAASELIRIGAHTIHHPQLSKLRRSARVAEIVGGRDRLEALVGPVHHFAYPFGDDRGSAELVRAAGFRSACTTRPGPVMSDSNAMRLPRVYVGNWPAEDVLKRLAAVSRG